MGKIGRNFISSIMVLSILVGMFAVSVVYVSAESAPVNILIHDCEKTDNITAFNGYGVTLDTGDHTEGNSSVQFSTSGTNTTFQIAISPNTAKDITGVKYILFDLYTEDPNMFTYSDRAIEFIDSSNVNSGRMGTSEALGNLTLNAGWNHIKIELGAFNEGFNAAALSQISMFAVGQPNAATFKFDNVRLANDEGLDEIDYLYQDFSALNTGYNCFAIQDIDNTEAREGNSCLFTETYTGYNNFEVILHNAGLYDFSGITYLVFDFKTDNVNFFKNADDCAVSFFNDDAFSGRAVTSAALKSINLVQGWNHIVVPFSYTELQNNFDVTSINKIVLYSYYIAGYPDGQIYKFDNFRICNYEGFEKQEAAYSIVDKISAIGEVTAESNSAITEARNAYDSLTASQKDVVYNYSTLTSAEKTYLGILDNQKASTVIDYIDAIGTVTKDSGTVIKTARTAYDALTVEQQALVTNYSVLTDAEAAYKALIAGPVNILFNDCEKTDNITAFNGYNVTLDTVDHTEGNSSVQFSTSNQNTTFQIAITPNVAKNITGAKYILFDLYTEDPNMFTYSDRAIEFIDSLNVNSGRMGTSEALGNLTLKAGWNHIKIELGAFNEGFNATALSQISMFAVGQPNAATFEIDNVRLANDEGLAEKDYLYQDFSALNTGYNCFAIQDIDNTEARQGNTCLFTQTFKDYRNLEVIMQNTNSYNFSAITYLVFDLKTDDVNLFKNADDCAVSFFNGDAFSGRAVTSAALKSINLVQGWNHIVVPFSYTELQNNFDTSSISKISLYCYYIAGYTEGQIYKFDNFRICNYEGLVKQEAAYNIVDKIAAIGEVTIESNTAITEARTAYEALNASQKDVVYNYVTLTVAEVSYEQVLNAQAAAPVIGYINAIGTVTKDSGTAIDTARNAYNALTGEQQAAVSNYETLTAAETAFTKIQDDTEKADSVITYIIDIGIVTLESESKITAARTAYDALTADQKSLVNNYDVLTAAETVLSKLKDDTAKADEAETLITDIGTVTVESGAKITAARTAYDALTADQKLLVNNYDVLTAAEAAYDALVVYGDINGDGKITAADALLALQYSVQKITLTEQQIKAADIDNKAGVTAADALLILQYSVDKIDLFPVQNVK